MKVGLLLALSSALAACTSSIQAEPTTPSALNVRASELNGQKVEVRGILSFESHARQLWTSADDIQQNSIENCLTLVGTDKWQDKLARLNGRTVTIRGKLFEDVVSGNVDLGACSKVGLGGVGYRVTANDRDGWKADISYGAQSP